MVLQRAVNASQSVPAEDLLNERACFYGTLLSTLAYGALAMLYIQLIQVLLVRPRRDRTFWTVVSYSVALAVLATLAISTRLKFSEQMYINNRTYPGGLSQFYRDFSANSINSIGYVCTTFFSWFADILMLSRLHTIWNRRWWVLVFPIFTYLAKSAISIPLLVCQLRPYDLTWSPQAKSFETSYHSTTLAFNLYASFMLAFQIVCIRKKLETVTGRVHALFYTSCATIFVECGSFYTLWVTVYLGIRTQENFVQDVFLSPSTFILGITRMLIVLRIAQDRAWSRDLVTASHRGVLDWHVSSTHSVQLNDNPSTSATSFQNKRLSQKLEGDVIDLPRI